MKKGILVISSLVALIGLTGCGGKKLTCTMENNSLGLEMSQKVEITFKKDKIDDMKIVMDVKVPDEYKDQKQDLIDELKDLDEGMKVTETKDGIRAEMTADDDDFKEFNIDGESVSYDEVKKAFEAKNYTCK